MNNSRHSLKEVDFNCAPLLLIWEVTQACALACQHCRAEAQDGRDLWELTCEEGKKLIEETARMGTPLFIFSGGDPLQRNDLEELIHFAKSEGLHVGAIPAATRRLTRERVFALKKVGLDQMALSLDGASEASHDRFRGVCGSFQKTLEGASYAHEADIPLQINTCFGTWNFSEFEAIAGLVQRLGVVFWEVFFLVPIGRGAFLKGLTSEQFEILFERLLALAKRVRFVIKVTEAPHYRRFVFERKRKRDLKNFTRIGVNAGRGFCFVSHRGDVFPSGFLPISAGNVREHSIFEIYRNSPLFQELRDSTRLKGRCGRCEYRDLCGGSRSRAYAVTGDHLAEEPCCLFEPQITLK